MGKRYYFADCSCPCFGIRTFRPENLCTPTGQWRPVRPDVPARDIFYADAPARDILNADIPARIMDDPANFFLMYKNMYFKHLETQTHLRKIGNG